MEGQTRYPQTPARLPSLSFWKTDVLVTWQSVFLTSGTGDDNGRWDRYYAPCLSFQTDVLGSHNRVTKWALTRSRNRSDANLFVVLSSLHCISSLRWYAILHAKTTPSAWRSVPWLAVHVFDLSCIASGFSATARPLGSSCTSRSRPEYATVGLATQRGLRSAS